MTIQSEIYLVAVSLSVYLTIFIILHIARTANSIRATKLNAYTMQREMHVRYNAWGELQYTSQGYAINVLQHIIQNGIYGIT